MTAQQTSDGSGTPQEVEIESVVQRVREIGDRVESTELPGELVSVDFGLFKRYRFERALERGNDGSIGDVVDRGALPESVADFGQRKLDSAGSEMNARSAGDDIDVDTQRTGGLCKSSIILSLDGIVTEYNLRLPPIDAAEYPQTAVESRLDGICRNSGMQVFDDGSVGEEIFARPRFPEEIEDDMKEYIRSQGYLRSTVPDDEWYPHVRSSECSVPVSGFLDYTESILSRFDRHFPDSRRWTMPKGGWRKTGTDPLDELKGSVAEFQDSGTSITFQLPRADEQSRIQTSGGRGCSYELALPAYDSNEFGKILLEKAVDHVVETRGILLNSNRRLDARDDVYRLYIENPSCTDPLDAIAADVTILIGAYDTIRERSRLS